MISTIKIQRFKCFENQAIQFGKLTLLVGANATGKSTVIQALLLLWQSHLTSRLERGELVLTGSLVNVGTAKDILYSKSKEDTIAFEFYSDVIGKTTCFEFKYPQEPEKAHVLFSNQTSNTYDVRVFEYGLTYLSAERLGPRLIYPMSERALDEMTVGPQGEYTAHCLAEFEHESVSNKVLAYPGSESSELKHQAELWMRRIIPNLDIEIESISQADSVRLGLRNQGLDTEYLRPTNTGFGISYTLPIIVAALMSKPDKMLIIENPEAHLHPASQSELGKFLARVAASGIQVIIETHSDHILNGVRIAVRRQDIDAKDIAIHFFEHDTKSNHYRVLNPKVDEDGHIDLWPNGFFDQLEKDLMELA